MSRAAVFPDPLSTELCRLAEVEHTALLANDIPTFLHSRLRWCELILSLCPGLTAAAPTLAKRVSQLGADPQPAVPAWKLDLLARPLVPIVRRVVRTRRLPDGNSYQTAVEYLACGHTHQVLPVFDSDLRARRRRCRECGDARLSARSRRESTLFAVPPSKADGDSIREGGQGRSPEQRHGAVLGQPRPALGTRG